MRGGEPGGNLIAALSNGREARTPCIIRFPSNRLVQSVEKRRGVFTGRPEVAALCLDQDHRQLALQEREAKLLAV